MTTSSSVPSTVASGTDIDETLVDVASNVLRVLPSGMKVIGLRDCHLCRGPLGPGARCWYCHPDARLLISNPGTTIRVDRRTA